MLARAEEIGEEVNGCIGRKREREREFSVSGADGREVDGGA